MIVSVFLRIASDDGQPAMMAEDAQMYVHRAKDFESNLLGTAALMDRMIGEQREKMVEQIGHLREAEASGAIDFRKPS